MVTGPKHNRPYFHDDTGKVFTKEHVPPKLVCTCCCAERAEETAFMFNCGFQMGTFGDVDPSALERLNQLIDADMPTEISFDGSIWTGSSLDAYLAIVERMGGARRTPRAH